MPLTVWKNGLIWLSRPFKRFLAFLDQNWSKIRSKTPKNDPKSQILSFPSNIHAKFLRLCGKGGLILLSKPSRRFLVQNWPKNEAQNGPEGPVRAIFHIFYQNIYSVLHTVQKNGLIWLSRPSRTFSAVLDLNWPKIRSKMPRNDPNSQISIVSIKIHSQCMKMCGKVAIQQKTD